MYTKMLVPLDGSQTAEQVLPYARFFTSQFAKPVELIAAIDIAEMIAYVSAQQAVAVYEMIQRGERATEAYLKGIAGTFRGADIKCNVQKGRAENVIIDSSKSDPTTLITMATHGRSGLNRWLLGSVAEKVLRGSAYPLLMVRAKEGSKSDGEASLKSILVPLDGSALSESVLPTVAVLAKNLDLAVTLFRSYSVPYTVYGFGYGYHAVDVGQLVADMRHRVYTYLEQMAAEIKKFGVEKISYVCEEGFSADEIIKAARETPDSLIAMCSHGRSGVKRWGLGSVAENVVRYADNPVLVLRPSGFI